MLLPCKAERRAAVDAVTPEEITENSDTDVKTRRVSVVLFCFVFFLDPLRGHGSRERPVTKWKIHNLVSQRLGTKLISMLNYSLCQMKDATINVYERLGVEVWVIVSWRIELGVCLRAVKTKHSPCHCHAF